MCERERERVTRNKKLKGGEGVGAFVLANYQFSAPRHNVSHSPESFLVIQLFFKDKRKKYIYYIGHIICSLCMDYFTREFAFPYCK